MVSLKVLFWVLFYFILYINDFSRASDLLFAILFTDDTSVFIEGKSYTGVINSVNNELQKVNEWFKSNKLTLNVEKTHYMLFHRTRIKDHKINVVLQDDLISEANSLTFLGVIIDNKLKWHDHIMYITKYQNPLVLYTNPGNMLTSQH